MATEIRIPRNHRATLNVVGRAADGEFRPLDGAPTLELEEGQNLVTMTVDEEGGEVRIVAGDVEGTVTGVVTADARLGSGTKTLEQPITIVVSDEASSLEVSFINIASGSVE